MKKIFILTVEIINDCCDMSPKPMAFKNYDDAKKVMNKLVASFLEEMEIEIEEGTWIVEQSEKSFSAYEDGYWAHNHYSVSIHRVELV